MKDIHLGSRLRSDVQATSFIKQRNDRRYKYWDTYSLERRVPNPSAFRRSHRRKAAGSAKAIHESPLNMPGSPALPEALTKGQKTGSCGASHTDAVLYLIADGATPARGLGAS